MPDVPRNIMSLYFGGLLLASGKNSLFALEKVIMGPFQKANLAELRVISDTSLGPTPPQNFQGHPETHGALACQIETYSQGPCPTCLESERFRASRIRPGSFLSTSHERRSPSSGPRLPMGGLPSVVSKDGESRAEGKPVEGTGVPRGASKPPDEACLMVENAPPQPLSPNFPAPR